MQPQKPSPGVWPEVLSFETLTPEMGFSGVLYKIPQEEQLENTPASEEKSKT